MREYLYAIVIKIKQFKIEQYWASHITLATTKNLEFFNTN